MSGAGHWPNHARKDCYYLDCLLLWPCGDLFLNSRDTFHTLAPPALQQLQIYHAAAKSLAANNCVELFYNAIPQAQL
jgi:hypothetical protein